MRRTFLTAMACLTVGLLAHFAGAQDKPIKIGVANVQRVINESMEGKEVSGRSEASEKDFQAQAAQKEKDLRDLRAALQRDLKPGTPQYEEKRKELVTKQVEAKNWSDVTQQDIVRTKMQNLKLFFDRLDQAVNEVAAKRGLDLIMADMRQAFPESIENLTPQDFQRILASRGNVLYANPSIDVTADVIAAWDAHYKEKK